MANPICSLGQWWPLGEFKIPTAAAGIYSLRGMSNLKLCLQVHDILVGARELVHYFVLLLLALQREDVFQ